MQLQSHHKMLILILLGCLGLVIYWLLDESNILPAIQDGARIIRLIESSGVMGPILIVLLMTIAILVSPLPSAPIAIAAGAVYGHYWGTLYVLLGSLCGATGAFFIARYLGYDYVQKIANGRVPRKIFNSQNALMGFVLVTRLMPFLSFDIISYAAGLTRLLFWRFFIATIVGIAPASFFLAHVGSELATAEIGRMAIAVLAIGLVTGISVMFGYIRNKKSPGA